jgi:hypothetical protein
MATADPTDELETIAPKVLLVALTAARLSPPHDDLT